MNNPLGMRVAGREARALHGARNVFGCVLTVIGMTASADFIAHQLGDIATHREESAILTQRLEDVLGGSLRECRNWSTCTYFVETTGRCFGAGWLDCPCSLRENCPSPGYLCSNEETIKRCGEVALTWCDDHKTTYCATPGTVRLGNCSITATATTYPCNGFSGPPYYYACTPGPCIDVPGPPLPCPSVTGCL